jgi:hypothetical protein
MRKGGVVLAPERARPASPSGKRAVGRPAGPAEVGGTDELYAMGAARGEIAGSPAASSRAGG